MYESVATGGSTCGVDEVEGSVSLTKVRTLVVALQRKILCLNQALNLDADICKAEQALVSGGGIQVADVVLGYLSACNLPNSDSSASGAATAVSGSRTTDCAVQTEIHLVVPSSPLWEPAHENVPYCAKEPLLKPKF